jgi:hypothetical protein
METDEKTETDEQFAARVANLNARVPRLMGATEVAQVLGVAQPNLNKVARLPEPCADLMRGRVWRADVIHEFASRRGRNGKK